MTNTPDIDKLYGLDEPVSEEVYRAISMLRQLINEEYKPQTQVSNRFIYSILKDVLKRS